VEGKAKEYVRANGWLALVQESWHRFRMRMRGAIHGRTLGCAAMVLDADPRIRGARSIKVGHNFSAGKHLWLDAIRQYNGVGYRPRIVIGNNVVVSNAVHIAAIHSVIIGDGVLIGSNVLITDHNHGSYRGPSQSLPATPPALRELSSKDEIRIEGNVWIGDGCVILAGAHIGAGSIIGANSIVSGTIPAECIAMGAPAVAVRRYNHGSSQWEGWKED